MLRDTRPRRRPRTRVALTALVACAVVAAPLALALRYGEDAPLEAPRQVAGRAWVASPEQGTVSLLDGASREIVVSLPAPGSLAGDDLVVTQSGSSAYVVDRTLGTAARIDGATFAAGAAAGLAAPGGRPLVLEGGGAVYVLDPERRTAARAAPETLEVLVELSLAAEPGDGQAVVDDAGRLWVVDAVTGDLTWFDGTKQVEPLGLPDAQLVLVQGRAVLVDVAGGRVVRLGPDGPTGRWSCAGEWDGSPARILGSTTSDQVYSAVPADGTFVVASVGRDDCATAIELAEPGTAEFGPLAQDGRYVFVPDRTTGRTAVVDTSLGRRVADLELAGPGNRVELTSKDGIVFYNDLDSEVSGVISLEGDTWTPTEVQKFDPSTDEGVAVLGDSPAGDDATQTDGTGATDWAAVAPERDGRTAPSAPSSAVEGGPLIDGVSVRPDPAVLGQPVRLLPDVRGAVGTTWTWTITAADGTVVWTSDQPGPVDVTLEATAPASYTLSLEIVDSAGHRATSKRALDTVLVPTPHIEKFLVDDTTPGTSEIVHIAAVESGLPEGGATWQWSVTLPEKGLLFAQELPAGAPLPVRFPEPGEYEIALAVTSGTLEDVATVPVTVADRCVPALTGRRFIDLRRDGTGTFAVTADDCFVDSTVTVEVPPWLATDTASIDVVAGPIETVDGIEHTTEAAPVPVGVRVTGAPPSDGVVTGAVTLVLGDQRVPVDVRVNIPPVWTADPTCARDGSTDRAVVTATLADADAGSLDVRLTFDGVPDGPAGGYRMLPSGSSRGVYSLVVPAGVDLADVSAASIQPTDRFGAVAESRAVSLAACSS
ncbi:hypothetical protein [Cellulomonas xylanilytica]|uniref:PKD domain-containing protein n=1 Tax=Cellulomonas xylanilytica TaxID=233583 RepID=A0A510UYS5_9CELL|nr:hypothetical protein [Cellulomonas xylanilytica]GEK19823.1 hypothetical protein CXY01_03430 [Cellulomonas xylanilytica]